MAQDEAVAKLRAELQAFYEEFDQELAEKLKELPGEARLDFAGGRAARRKFSAEHLKRAFQDAVVGVLVRTICPKKSLQGLSQQTRQVAFPFLVVLGPRTTRNATVAFVVVSF